MNNYPKLRLSLALAVLVAATSSCGVTNTDSQVSAGETPYTGSIRVNLKRPANPANNDYSLLFAASQDVLTLGVCVAKKTPTCTVGGQGYFAANLIYNDGKKNFFMPKSSAILEDGLILTVVGSDSSGAIVDTRNVKFSSGAAASTPAATPSSPSPSTTPATTPSTPSPSPTTTPSNTASDVGNTGNTGTTDNSGGFGGGNAGGGDFGGGGGGW